MTRIINEHEAELKETNKEINLIHGEIEKLNIA